MHLLSSLEPWTHFIITVSIMPGKVASIQGRRQLLKSGGGLYSL